MQPYNILLIVAGKKTETRRVIKLSNPDDWHIEHDVGDDHPTLDIFCNSKTGEKMLINSINGKRPYDLVPRYSAGEVVYIKEAWKIGGWDDENGRVYIEFSGEFSPTNPKSVLVTDDILTKYWVPNAEWPEKRWRFPRFLPERFARHFAQIGEPRPERLQDITEEGAIAEGSPPGYILASPTIFHKGQEGYTETPTDYRGGYARLWDTINGAGSWDRNEWVMVYPFKYLEAHNKN